MPMTKLMGFAGAKVRLERVLRKRTHRREGEVGERNKTNERERERERERMKVMVFGCEDKVAF